MAIKPNQIRESENHSEDTFSVAAHDKFVDAVAELKEEMVSQKTELEETLSLLHKIEKNLNASSKEMKQVSTYMSDKRYAMQNTIISGAGDAITKLGDEAQEKMESITQEYEDYLRTLKRESQARTNQAFRVRNLKKIGEVGKVALLWILVIGGILMIILRLLGT